MDEYDPEVYGHKIIANDSNIVFLYYGSSIQYFHDLDSVQRIIHELKGYIKHSRFGELYSVTRLKLFLWAEERMIHHLREKKLKNILEY